MNRQRKRIIKSIIASILLVSVLVSTDGITSLLAYLCGSDYPFAVQAAETENVPEEYVSELKIYEGNNPDTLKNQIEKDGYYYADQDMNQSAGGTYTYLAYKTTNDKSDAVTNIRLLSQDTGYRMVDYGSIMDANCDELQPLASQLRMACIEYSNQLQSGSPAAVFSNKTLNQYYIMQEDGRKRPLGDYLADQEYLTNSQLFRIISRASASMISTVYKYIALGVSSYADLEDTTWIDRLSENGMVNFVYTSGNSEVKETLSKTEERKKAAAEKTFWANMDKMYKSNAMDLKTILVSYATNVTEALAYAEEHGGKINPEETGTGASSMEEIAEQMVKESEEIYEHDGDYISEEHKVGAYPAYIVSYEAFNEYPFECKEYGTNTVGEYLVALGKDFEENDNEQTCRNAYAFIRAMSNGQYTMTRMCGILSLLSSLNNSDEAFEEGYKELEALKASMEKNGLPERINIWDSVDEDMYKQKVAVTDTVSRGMQSSAEMKRDRRNWVQKRDAELQKHMKWINLISDGCTVLYLGTMLGTAIFAGSANLWALSVAACQLGWGISAGFVMAGILGFVCLGIGVLSLVVCLGLLIWSAITAFANSLGPKEEKPDYQKDKIPRTIYEAVERKDKANAYYYTKYMSVDNQKGEAGDINGYSQKLWDVLYYTKADWVGSPLRTDSVGTVFKFVKNNPQLVEKGYESLNLFGNDTVANLNMDTKTGDPLYLYYRTVDSINKEESGGSEDEPINDNPKYLSDILIIFGNDDGGIENKKAKIKKEGFSVLEQDLSQGLDNYIGNGYDFKTYIGIKTTENPDNAIRDIRVAPYYVGSSMRYGQAAYTIAGMLVKSGDSTTIDGGFLACGAGMYYTKSKEAGPPILADLKITDQLLDWDNKEGWEPINSFAGGIAADFKNGGFYDPSYNDIALTVDSTYFYHRIYKTHTYVYFKTAENYNTKPDAKTYLGGISFVGGPHHIRASTYTSTSSTGEYDSGQETIYLDGYYGYVQELGVEPFGPDLCETLGGRKQLISYTKTHNPYRAVYGISTYESQNNMISVNIIKAGNGYAVCDTYQQEDKNSFNWDDNIKRVETETACAYKQACSFRAVVPYHCFNQFYKEGISNRFREAMYVTGKTNDKEPILLEDIQFGSEPEMDGYVGVHSILNSYENKAYNLHYSRSDSKPIYMFVKGEAPTPAKYISSISVGVGKGDVALVSALSGASEDTELIPINFADKMDTVLKTAEERNINSVDYKQMLNYDANNCAYICVERTNTASKALSGILKVRTDEKDIANQISVDGKIYKKASDMIESKQGNWYMFVRSNRYESPIQQITMSANPFENMMRTIPSVAYESNVDAKGNAICNSHDYKNTDRVFIHTNDDMDASYFEDLFLCSGDGKLDAQIDALNTGASGLLDYNLNTNVGGKYVYLAYNRTPEPDYAVRDIIITRGKKYEEKYDEDLERNYIMLNNQMYESAGDISLNEGTEGAKLYLYYDCQDDYPLPPYQSLYVGLGDSIPVVFADGVSKEKINQPSGIMKNISDDEIQYLYERIVDEQDQLLDMNAGLFATKNGIDVESRLYLYGAREDKTVKEAAASKTFERDGKNITLFGTYGEKQAYGEYRLK